MIRITAFLFFISLQSSGQLNPTDSLKILSEKETSDTNRIYIWAKLSNFYKDQQPLTGLAYAQKGINLARKIKFLRGEATCLNALGDNYRRIGEYIKGLEAHFSSLKIFEKLSDLEGITKSYHGISVIHEDRGDYKEALLYAYKVLPLASNLKNRSELMRIQSNIGKIYERSGELDSALHYEQNAYEIALSSKDSSITGNILSRLGNIYLKIGNQDMALVYYKIGIPIAIANNDNNSLTELFHDLARLFQLQGKTDSALFYAKLDLTIATQMPLPEAIIDASYFLTSIYNNVNVDSAYKYLLIATSTRDSIYTNEKSKQIQILGFEEAKRQDEISEKLVQEKEEHSHNLQYAALGILILASIILFLLLSRSLVVNENWIKFLGIIVLLIVFEFVNLLIHPYLGSITQHSPILMLFGLVIIASILAPFHHKLESWIKVRMVEKNKQIRLTAAKSVIAADKITQDGKPE